MYLGDFKSGDSINFKFNSRASAGTPITLSTGVVTIFKGSGLINSTSGVTLSTNFSVTGCNHVLIDTSVNTVFYSTGFDYQVVLASGTVDSVSVNGTTLREFSIQNRGSMFNEPIDNTVSFKQVLRAIGALVAGQSSGGGTNSIIFKAINDATTTRITATVDSSGNRSSVTLNI